MSAITTHVLDTAAGSPASGVPVRLELLDGEPPTILGDGRTDVDGRIADLGPDRAETGTYRLRFDTAAYFASTGSDGFYPEVVISFAVRDPDQHYHVPLLLSPFGYSTYRGS
ncbi:hydroxyisourate hydrolase [Solicola gregarius]|uniref:5-hydroxyisourate hydrolase n=1 Tax=Solicola gregarius TaxID=2908642 RepID=A0AA46TI03_9ACTN|nr:hydroxyisourate hydrolase [Solicola gregarius]UYM05541.1 hydroxyisourate hydrolase [Solicola gregarius]